jgi:hypothetical protein
VTFSNLSRVTALNFTASAHAHAFSLSVVSPQGSSIFIAHNGTYYFSYVILGEFIPPRAFSAPGRVSVEFFDQWGVDPLLHYLLLPDCAGGLSFRRYTLFLAPRTIFTRFSRARCAPPMYFIFFPFLSPAFSSYLLALF